MTSSTRLPTSLGTLILILLAAFLAISSTDGQTSNARTADARPTNTILKDFIGPDLQLDGAPYPTDSIVGPDLRTFGIPPSDQPARFSLADPSSGEENLLDSTETVTPVAEAATWAMATLTVFALCSMQRRRIYQFLRKTIEQSRSSLRSSAVTTARSS